jgi:hypothetical protein
VTDASSSDGPADVATGCAEVDGGTTAIDPASTPHLAVAGDDGSTYGVFDPSLVWPDGGATGYLSYTSLETGSLFTRVAGTTDGVSFEYIGDANAYADVTVTTTDPTVCGSTTCTARLVHETSSIVEDVADPDPSRRFKLFDFSYVIVPAASSPAQYAWGYIGLYTAATPETGWSAGTKAIGWSSSADGVSSQGAATVLTSVPALQDCLAFTEPAALVDGSSGVLYLALGCATGSSTRVVLARSTDHASTFSYVGELLSVADGTALGSTLPGVQPTDFFQAGGATYLIVSTFGTTPAVPDAPSGYSSCTTVIVDDLATASVHRDGSGNAALWRKLVAPGGAFAGACAYKSQFASGYFVPEVVAAAAMPEVVLRSGITCP